mgnify:CR=1 FL=1
MNAQKDVDEALAVAGECVFAELDLCLLLLLCVFVSVSYAPSFPGAIALLHYGSWSNWELAAAWAPISRSDGGIGVSSAQ